MADTYVYYFTILNQRTGESMLTRRRATLEAIKRNRGEPVFESQLEVDLSEVDSSGFLVRSVGGSHPADELWGEIRSLNLRAASREREALQLDEYSEGPRRHVLDLESRELRKEAERLQKKRSDTLAAELGHPEQAAEIKRFGTSPTPE
ncbi:MAG TPA: hypothetical protein VGO37_07260 [Steroidobacteraceae bacterium]|jgi:hypothetical protein|nr:hypothetical protein [Steroidobacteraceae bacterium]